MLAVQILISPWKLLHQQMNSLLRDTGISDKAFQAVFKCLEKGNGANSNKEHSSIAKTSTGSLRSEVEQGTLLADLNGNITGFVENVATNLKMTVPMAKETCEQIADVLKCIAIVSSTFHMVALCAAILDMAMEVNVAKSLVVYSKRS